jgi:hypothetical protein
LDPFTRCVMTKKASDPLVEAMCSLPTDVLLKTASMCGMHDNDEWLDRFKGTPLFDQAMELMQEELQQDSVEMQQRQMSQQLNSQGDQLRMKRRMLELELARQDSMPAPQAIPGMAGPTEVPTSPIQDPQGAATQASIPSPTDQQPKTAAEATSMDVARGAGVGGALGSAVGFLGGDSRFFTGNTLGAMGAGALSSYGLTSDTKHPILRGMGMGALGGVPGGAISYSGIPGGAGIGAIEGGFRGAVHGGINSYLLHRKLVARAAAEEEAAAAAQQNEKMSAPISLLRAMSKEAGTPYATLGSSALHLLKRNPGAAAGTAVGAIGGGIAGAQKKIDPVTGQATGGGVGGALTGAIGGGAVGGAVGLGAQGAIRSGRAIHGIAKATKASGGTMDYGKEIARQARLRTSNVMNDVSQASTRAGFGIADAGQKMRYPKPAPIVEPPFV